jgi:hypothetical protein
VCVARLLSKAAKEGIAVFVRHRDVDQRDMRSVRLDSGERLGDG